MAPALRPNYSVKDAKNHSHHSISWRPRAISLFPMLLLTLIFTSISLIPETNGSSSLEFTSADEEESSLFSQSARRLFIDSVQAAAAGVDSRAANTENQQQQQQSAKVQCSRF